jgi:hypothetical protein
VDVAKVQDFHVLLEGDAYAGHSVEVVGMSVFRHTCYGVVLVMRLFVGLL